jgi:L-alanine-DL-glutamate epimerase and related enzymes of enolase superfamily
MPKITNIEIIELGEEGEKSSPWSSTILVLRLTTSDGVVGYGEAPTTLMTRPVYEQMREVARLFINKDVENINGNYFEFYKNSFYLPVSMESTSALSAFEIASWDIVGKIHGLPIYEILGGKVRDKIRAYANGWYNDCVTPEDFLSKAKIVESMGFTAVKFDPFGSDYHHLSEEGLLNAREIVSTIKNETNLDILIEYHGRFNANSAIRAINTLQEFDPIFHEEPVHPDELVGLRRVRDATDAPIALGERVLNKKNFYPILQITLLISFNLM